MDFSKIKIISILESGLSNRFQDFPATHFEDFIAQLFRDNGYIVQQTPYSGDFGADLIINKSIAVQVKRYAKDNKVGVQDINQVIGAKEYYKCSSTMIITTSLFTEAGKELAAKTKTILWDWNKLYDCICKTYLEGKNHYDYFNIGKKDVNYDNDFSFNVTKTSYEDMKRIGPCTLIYAKMKNLTNRNINVTLILPTFISKENYQHDAIYWFTGYFSEGTIYAGCEIEMSFMFKTDQIRIVKDGDRILFKWYEDVKFDLGKGGIYSEITVYGDGTTKANKLKSQEYVIRMPINNVKKTPYLSCLFWIFAFIIFCIICSLLSK